MGQNVFMTKRFCMHNFGLLIGDRRSPEVPAIQQDLVDLTRGRLLRQPDRTAFGDAVYD